MSKVTLTYKIEAYDVMFNDLEFIVMTSWTSKTRETEYAVYDIPGMDVIEEQLKKIIIEKFLEGKKEMIDESLS